LAAESFDVLLLAGDLGTTRMDHFKGLLRAIKEAVPDRPILAVRGNHDLWDKKKRYYFAGGAFRDLRLLLKYQEQLFDEFGVYHLERGPFFVGNVVVVGWDGWYHTDPPTNDILFLPDFGESGKGRQSQGA
jgi:predicted phosphohydrolase